VTPQEQNDIRAVHERIDDLVESVGGLKGSINGVAIGVENICEQLTNLQAEIHGAGKNPGLRGRVHSLEATNKQRQKRVSAIKAAAWSVLGGIGTVALGWLASLFTGDK
jgi:hypothetical protein